MTTPMYIPPVLATVEVPVGAQRLYAMKPKFHCECGFGRKHPYCHSCGLGIGPSHVQTHGAMALFDVYADRLNEATGDWEIVHEQGEYLVCYSCKWRISHQALIPHPIRLESHTRERAAGANAWKRRQIALDIG